MPSLITGWCPLPVKIGQCTWIHHKVLEKHGPHGAENSRWFQILHKIPILKISQNDRYADWNSLKTQPTTEAVDDTYSTLKKIGEIWLWSRDLNHLHLDSFYDLWNQSCDWATPSWHMHESKIIPKDQRAQQTFCGRAWRPARPAQQP